MCLLLRLAKELQQVEPCITGLAGIHSTYTGIVDYGEVTRSLATTLQGLGGSVYTGFPVSQARQADAGLELVDGTHGQSLLCSNVLTCAGLYADRVSMLFGGSKHPQLVPIRGDFLKIRDNSINNHIQGMVYPVPNPKFPFLGVHFTRRIDGEVWLGPNAVVAWSREGYSLTDMNAKDTFEMLTHTGFLKLVFGNLAWAIGEAYRGINRNAYVASLQRYMPTLSAKDTQRSGSGVRALAVDHDGSVVEDFVYEKLRYHGVPVLNLRNAPSPAATSSLAIAEDVADQAQKHFGLS